MPDGSNLPFWPRALREPLAAAYVGLSGSTFRQVVVPKVAAIKLTTGRVAWLREDLDAWLDSKRSPVAIPVDAPVRDVDGGAVETFNVRNAIADGLAALSSKRRSRRPNAPG